jgi:GT2 family glycosyltransferase/tetratricopeptide (TPR) repeat protein
MSNVASTAERWVREGDALRDSGQPGKAAAAYRRAVELRPDLSSIHVQLGNMLKDAGRFADAERAYRDALERGADAADTNVQLGRALRLDGRRDAALQAFTAALKANAGSRDAVRELIALGESWTAQQHIGLGASVLAEAVASLDAVARTLARVERRLPEVASLSSIPPSRWDLWRRLWHVPPAPQVAVKLGLLVIADAAPLPAVLACLSSIRDQRHDLLLASIISAEPDAQKALAHEAMLHPSRFCLARTEADAHPATRLLSALRAPELGDATWIGVATEPVVLDREAIGWLASELGPGRAVAAFSDEDVVEWGAHGGLGEAVTHSEPWLKGAADPELLEAGHALGSLVVARRDLLIRELETLGAAAAQSKDPAAWWPTLHRKLSANGAIAHAQKVLVSRQKSARPARDAAAVRRVVTPSVRAAAQGKPDLVHVLVPTRDRLDLLRPCIAALRGTAEVPSAVAITVIDHGSREPETAAYLEKGRGEGWLDVLARDEPFNWSRLNNAAAARSTAPIVVFANNDIEMTTAGWDTKLRDLLSQPGIGAVGARLLYPDRTVQHAGIVLGIGPGGSEHEGRGAAADDGGPGGRWLTRRSVSAVTGAFIACRRANFEAVGGFDADDLGIWFSDVDLCLKLGRRGLRVVYEPAIEALHHESKTLAAELDDRPRAAVFEAAAAAMRRRWGATFEHDPYFNLHYARWGTPFAWLKAGGGGGWH